MTPPVPETQRCRLPRSLSMLAEALRRQREALEAKRTELDGAIRAPAGRVAVARRPELRVAHRQMVDHMSQLAEIVLGYAVLDTPIAGACAIEFTSLDFSLSSPTD